ncbi:trypsin-like serine protease, partial [bacterium]|nr:trypsin-like serine protease [bacterium]
MMNRIKTLAWIALGLALFLPPTGQAEEPDSLAAATAQARRTGIVIAAERVMPTVVSITVLQTRTYSSPFWLDPFFDEFFGNLFPREYSREIQSLGSGFIVSDDGKIVTNAHVVADATTIKVTLADGRTFDTNVMGIDAGLDLALLKLINPPEDLQSADLGNSDDLMIGEWAIALGNPFGFLIADAKPSVTAGVISAVGRRIQTGEAKRFSYSGVIQTDAAINPGNSGGPLLDSTGKIIGINSVIISPTGASVGIGFAVPVNTAKRILPELIKKGYVSYPWIGASVYPLIPEFAKFLSLKVERGAMISEVVKGGPSERAGLRGGDREVRVGNSLILVGGDVIVEIDGEKVMSSDDLIR